MPNFTVDLKYENGEFVPRLDDKGRLVHIWALGAFKTSFTEEVMAHDINIKHLLVVMNKRHIGLCSNIKSYEFSSDGRVVRIHIELNNGIQSDNKVNPKSEDISRRDGGERIESNVVES